MFSKIRPDGKIGSHIDLRNISRPWGVNCGGSCLNVYEDLRTRHRLLALWMFSNFRRAGKIGLNID